MISGRETRAIRVPFWWVVLGFAYAIVSPLLFLLVAVQVAENNTRQSIEAWESVLCETWRRTLGEYEQNPPSTETGRGLQGLYEGLYRERGCQPPR